MYSHTWTLELNVPIPLSGSETLKLWSQFLAGWLSFIWLSWILEFMD